MGAVQVYQAANDPKDQARINAILRAASSLRDRLEETRWKVGDGIACPSEHAVEHITLGKFAFPPAIPAKDDIGDLLEASREANDRLARLHGRALGRLALAAKELERAGPAADRCRGGGQAGCLNGRPAGGRWKAVLRAASSLRWASGPGSRMMERAESDEIPALREPIPWPS
jgi:hypothetical protein